MSIRGAVRRSMFTGIWKIAALMGGFLLAAGGRKMIRWRDKLMPRRDPTIPFEDFLLSSRDGVTIACRRLGGGKREAVIVAHPAVTGQRYAPLVDLAEMLSFRFDVYTFDFRGHGRSGGRLELDLAGPVEDLRAVVDHLRSRGYAWVGVVGFSLGGMAALVYADRYPGLDALVAVGAAPVFPDIEPYRRWLPVWSLFLRFLGARFRPRSGDGPVPLEVAESLPDIPLLIVHGENEVFYRRSDLEEMLRRSGGKAEFWEIKDAGHTDLAGREADLARWLEEKASGKTGDRGG